MALIPAPSGLSSASLNVSASDFDIQCHEEYGVNVNVRDCENAIAQIRPADSKIEFMDREDPDRPQETMPLPYRLMGGTPRATLPLMLCIECNMKGISLIRA